MLDRRELGNHEGRLSARSSHLSASAGRPVWALLSALGTLVTPFIAHLRAHPDFLALMHGRVDTQEDAEFILGIRCMLAARMPQASSQETDDYAAVMHAMAAGGMHVGHERDAARQDVYLREIPRALAAYLALAEAGQ